ncbi:hypothetical protein MTO96_008760 [Rhipicephalus appendiculatus]
MVSWNRSWLPNWVPLNSSDSLEFHLESLVPGSTYSVCVEAENSAGYGNATCGNFTTEDSAPDPPASIWSSEQTESSLKIQWDPPVRKNGALVGYKLNSSLSHTFNGILNKSWLPNLVSPNSSDSREFYFRRLVPGSTYLVCVEAETSAGFGNAICDHFTTKDSAPDAPASIWSSEQTESSIKIQWDPPVRKNGALTGYKLNTSLSHTFNDISETSRLRKLALLNSSDSPEFYLQDLVPGSTYLVCIEAETTAGFGDAICAKFSTRDSAPDAPASIWSSAQTENSITIHWDPPVLNNGALTGYKLNSSLSHTFNGILVETWIPNTVWLNASDTLEFYLQGLIPGSTYLVCVEAETIVGFGNATCDNFSTKVSAPDAPASIWSSERTESSLKIQWEPPPRKNGALTGYKLNSSLSHTYNGVLEKSWLTKWVLINSSESVEFFLQDLVPGSTYLVCVEAKTSAGFGNATCDIFSTMDSAPDAPASIWSSEETESSLKIQWEPPVHKNGALTGYKLNSSLSHTYNDALENSWVANWVSINSSDSPEFYLENLVPGSTYLLCVEAETSAGFGNAICGSFITKDSVPDAPVSIWSTEQTESSLKIEWDPPVRKNGVLTGYKLNYSLTNTFNDGMGDSWLPKSLLLNSSDSSEFYVQDLVPGSTYLVCIAAKTSAGFGNAICNNISTKTSDAEVLYSPSFFLAQLNSSLSHTYNGVPEKSWLSSWASINSSDSTEFYLEDLEPGSTYLVCVAARTSAGFGKAICENFSTKDLVELFAVPYIQRYPNKILAPEVRVAKQFGLDGVLPPRSGTRVNVLGLCRGGNQCWTRKCDLRQLYHHGFSLWLSEQTESSLKIHWSPPLHKNGALTGYKLNCSLSHTFNGILARSRLSKPVLLNSSDSPELDLRGLDPGSTYLVCVEAKTSAGYGDAICGNFSTEVSAPEAPASLWSSEQTESSLKIQWDPPIRKNGALTGYKFNSSLSHTFNEVLAESWLPKLALLNSSDSPEFYLQDLVPGSTYLVCIEAKTTAGFGNATCENFITKDSVPDAPASIWSSEQSESSLKIQWDPPVRKNGALTGYKLNSSLSHTFDVILTESSLPKSVLLNSSDSPEFYLQGLVPGSTYLVCVEAETSAGFGNAICDNFTTNDSVEHFSNPHTQWYPWPESWLPNSVCLNSSDLTQFHLRDLFPGSTYLVCVEAETSAGFGNATCDNFSTKASVNGGSSAIEASIVIGAGLLLLILITAAGLTFCCIRRRRAAAYRSESSATQIMKELESRLPKPEGRNDYSPVVREKHHPRVRKACLRFRARIRQHSFAMADNQRPTVEAEVPDETLPAFDMRYNYIQYPPFGAGPQFIIPVLVPPPLRIETVTMPQKCHMCEEVFWNTLAYLRHSCAVQPIPGFTCPFCGWFFKNRECMQIHIHKQCSPPRVS